MLLSRCATSTSDASFGHATVFFTSGGGGFGPISAAAVAAAAAAPPGIGPDERVASLVATGVLRRGELDGRAMDALRRLGPDAGAVLEELVAADPARVRNPSAYVMGVISRLVQHRRLMARRDGGVDGAGGARAAGGRF